VDAVLRGQPIAVELRWRRPDGQVERRLELPARATPGDARGRRHGRRSWGDDDGAPASGLPTRTRGRGLEHEVEGARLERDGRGTYSERGDWAGRLESGDFGAGRLTGRAPWSERTSGPVVTPTSPDEGAPAPEERATAGALAGHDLAAAAT